MLPKDLLQAIKSGNVKKFYKSTIWRHKRKTTLKRDNFECQMCRKEGKVNSGEDGRGKGLVVHHKKHLKKRPDLALADSNLITVCESHHNKLHPEKAFQSKEKQDPITPERW